MLNNTLFAGRDAEVIVKTTEWAECSQRYVFMPMLAIESHSYYRKTFADFISELGHRINASVAIQLFYAVCVYDKLIEQSAGAVGQ